KHGYIKVLKTDNGGEFVNDAYKRSNTHFSTLHQTGAPYTPETQGQVEVINGVIKKAITKLMLQCRQIPTRFWQSFLPEVIRMLNRRVPSSGGASPFSLKNGVVPDVDEFIPTDKVIFI